MMCALRIFIGNWDLKHWLIFPADLKINMAFLRHLLSEIVYKNAFCKTKTC